MKKLLIIPFLLLFISYFHGMSIRETIEDGGCLVNNSWISIEKWEKLKITYEDCD